MSETVNIHFTTRGEYDLFSEDRIKAQKLARGVMYIFMLEIERDERRAGRVMAEVAKLPADASNVPGFAAPFELTIMDEDAQPVFRMAAFMKLDQVYLEPNCLVLISDGAILRQGYLMANDTDAEMVAELHELIGAGGDNSTSLL